MTKCLEKMNPFCFVIALSFSGFQLGSAATDEPACSKFPYEEQLLWKMLKLENKMEQWENELRKLQDTMLSVLVHQRDEMKRYSDIQNIKNTECCTECNNCMDQIRNMTSGMTENDIVALNAYTTASGSYTSNQIVIFPEVLLNLGNRYNPISGIFTAPIAGLYHFIAHVCNRRPTGMVISIFQGGTKIATSTVHENTGESCVSVNGVAMLEVGDVASVKSVWSSSQMFSDSLRRPSFTGILIHTQQK